MTLGVPRQKSFGRNSPIILSVVLLRRGGGTPWGLCPDANICPGCGPGVGSPTTRGLANPATGTVGTVAVPISGGSTPAGCMGMGGGTGLAAGIGMGTGMGIGSGIGISPCLAPIGFINN